MKRLMIMVITVLLLFGVVSGCAESEEAKGANKENIIIDIRNNAGFDIYAIEIGVYINQELKATQGSLNADGSKLEKGESLTFEFLEKDFTIHEVSNLEVVIEKINNKKTKANSYKLEIAQQKEFFLEIIGDSMTAPKLKVEK